MFPILGTIWTSPHTNSHTIKKLVNGCPIDIRWPTFWKRHQKNSFFFHLSSIRLQFVFNSSFFVFSSFVYNSSTIRLHLSSFVFNSSSFVFICLHLSSFVSNSSQIRLKFVWNSSQIRLHSSQIHLHNSSLICLLSNHFFPLTV